MNNLREGVGKIANSPMGHFLRNTLGVRPTYYRPLASRFACSDLFPWRVSSDWQTKIDLVNITSMVFPEGRYREEVRVVVFNEAGREITTREFELEPFERREWVLQHFPSDRCTQGSFAVFHRPLGSDNPFVKAGTCLSECGYVAYRRVGSQLWKFAHGSSYVLAVDTVACDKDATPLQNNFRRPQVYRIQASFGDSSGAELFYLNPTGRGQRMEIVARDRDGKAISTRKIELPPLASFIYSVEHPSIFRIEAHSRIFMLRPIVFKYYESGFDVFHG